jgi:hypothetical protein
LPRSGLQQLPQSGLSAVKQCSQSTATAAQVSSDQGDFGMGVIMIRCPQTGREIPTGIEMDTAEFRRAPVFFSRVQCPVCAREHEWFAKDAWVCDYADAESAWDGFIDRL